jgi:hypothetical protein
VARSGYPISFNGKPQATILAINVACGLPSNDSLSEQFRDVGEMLEKKQGRGRQCAIRGPFSLFLMPDAAMKPTAGATRSLLLLLLGGFLLGSSSFLRGFLRSFLLGHRPSS